MQIHLIELGQGKRGEQSEPSGRLLDASERARAARFLDPAARRQFVRSREALRHLLGRYLGLKPDRVPILLGPRGKPRLDPLYGELHFNLSHAGDFGLFAFVQGHPVGIDLERIQQSTDLDGVAARFFDPAEREALRRLSPAGSVGAFYRVWTRREAVLKALGLGLSAPATAVSVSVAGPPAGWLIRVDESQRQQARNGKVQREEAQRQEAQRQEAQWQEAQSPVVPASSWLTCDLSPLPSYAAALAVPGGAGLRVSVQGVQFGRV
ncbi:4'-phosphopantetheinyl transferase family protein [Deinococcus sp.]|uniref:4'-phosphopantetheinyl transferase family protein n=1 Tax=Deinococcus sp. TaxID=47478 RepID=UPI003C7D410A